VIDKTKRTTLKALSGLTAAAAIPPGVATASTLLKTDTADSDSFGSDVTVSMVSGHGRWHSVKLTNTSNKAVTLKHVYPGIVTVNNNNYDINALFKSGPIVIEAGQSHLAVVATQNRNLPETEIPAGLTKQHPFKLDTAYKHFGQIKPVITTRNFFA